MFLKKKYFMLSLGWIKILNFGYIFNQQFQKIKSWQQNEVKKNILDRRFKFQIFVVDVI